jgi:glycine betaine/proline transport system substrate-binding protein
MIKRGNLAKVLLIMIGLVALMLTGAACGDGDDKEVIKFHNPQWETIEEHNAIASFIVEKGYGYPVEMIIGDTGTMEVALPTGELDVNMELWQANIPDWYDEVTANGTVVDLAGTKDLVANGANGQIIEATDQGWYVPTYVIEANPGLKAVSDLPNFIELFEDPEESGKGLWLSCTPGAACTKRFVAKANAYGLDQTYNVLTPGSYAALAAAIRGAYTAGEPVLAYYWEPTKLLTDLDMTQLEEPPWTQACADAITAGTAEEPYTSTIGCHDALNDVHTGVTASLVDRAPEVVDFLGKMFIGSLPLADLATWKTDNNKEWSDAAVYYLQQNESTWTTWVTDDAADNVREALAEEG